MGFNYGPQLDIALFRSGPNLQVRQNLPDIWAMPVTFGRDGFRKRNPSCVSADLPVGSNFRIFEKHVKSLPKKYSVFRNAQISLYALPSRPTKGRSRDRHETRGGMRWTRTAPQTTGADCGRRSRVVPTPRRWCQIGGLSADDGG